jgi:putative acetyltransferase
VELDEAGLDDTPMVIERESSSETIFRERRLPMHPKDDDLMIESADPGGEDARRLLDQLDCELVRLYGEEGKTDFLPDDARVPGGIFLVARLEGRPVGCGALRPMADGAGEVKRMFVEPGTRGRGVGRRIIGALEGSARRVGYSRLRLETGTRQPEAVRMYQRAGYGQIDNYGNYAGNPLSRCFEKAIVPTAEGV